ncbi:unnamed protein product [Taenia asiatica]|uniref:MIP-T3 domain-containing protein n=1 Tax=Taenia asiatica TaxID=60517 RepID=A0A0R3WAA6_TAEAS|nr:unnamed protein product [Taenia asiatica]
MKGLFTAEEMNADCIKDKEAKSAFLKKVIDYVTAAHNHTPDVKVSSIIAGKEAERTNALLQLLAAAVNKGVDNAACVNKALGVAQVAKEPPLKSDKKEKKRETNTSSEVARDVVAKSGDEAESKPPVPLSTPSDNGLECSTGPQPAPNVAEGVVATSPQSRTSRPPSAKGPKKPITESSQYEKQVTNADLSAKPSPGQSSLKAPTPDPPVFAEFPKKDTQESMEPPGPNALSSSSVAGIMVENEILSDDEDEDVAQRGEEEEGEENVSGIRLAHASGGEGDFSEVEDVGQANGGLVSKLLRSKMELGGEGTLHPNGSKQPSLIVVNEAAKKRDREATEREMERLCQILQNLTRSALPLGKLIDLMQEDFESIQTEYREWKAEDERWQQEIRKRESQTDPRLEELKEELAQLEQKQMEYRRAITSMKASILNNDQSIQQMLIQATETS